MFDTLGWWYLDASLCLVGISSAFLDVPRYLWKFFSSACHRKSPLYYCMAVMYDRSHNRRR
jgi:hypothetical protein